ncbi:hypothetical protein LEN26_012958 [Aphanomyces euteiches]|nr:hypothetical protein AeMF1_020453 [Aphanomyces euteiches]KAH9115707.1 hypothetical protein LEN26_012958 [Aphanomyces euteiches]
MADEIRRPKPTATAVYSRWSIFYNVVFVVNLASTPFMAYLTEPQPGFVMDQNLPQSNSFPEFVNTTMKYFALAFNKTTIDARAIYQQDITTNAFRMRHKTTLHYDIAEKDAFDFYVEMPAALFYGQGLRRFITAFLTANKTSRDAMQPWQLCQHQRFMGLPLSEICM